MTIGQLLEPEVTFTEKLEKLPDFVDFIFHHEQCHFKVLLLGVLWTLCVKLILLQTWPGTVA